MRITSKQRQAIKQTIHNFDPQALIYFKKQRKIKIKLYELIGEQKIYLIIDCI